MKGVASTPFLTLGGWRAKFQTLWRAWQSDGPAWLKTQVRRTYRRWVYACTAWMAVLVLFWFVHADALEEVWRTEQSLLALRQQLASRPAPLKGASEVSAPEKLDALVRMLDHLPGQSVQARLWPALQQSLERHHLKLLALRPVQEGLQAPLPSQAMALRLRGRFGDWMQAWESLSEGAPVWSLDRARISAQADSEQVEIDVQLRVWLRAGADGPSAWQGRGGGRGADARDHSGRVFVSSQPGEADPPQRLGQEPSLEADASGLQASAVSPDPEQWPGSQVRLVGVWQEGEIRHAILACGPHWVRARIGQRVSREGHRLETIGDQAVAWRAGQGPVQVLNFEKGPR